MENDYEAEGKSDQRFSEAYNCELDNYDGLPLQKRRKRESWNSCGDRSSLSLGSSIKLDTERQFDEFHR